MGQPADSEGGFKRQAHSCRVVDQKAAGHAAFVSDGRNVVQVGVVHPQNGQPYLRTYADGTWTDNLLALPTF